jgi:hypothetical protein
MGACASELHPQHRGSTGMTIKIFGFHEYSERKSVFKAGILRPMKLTLENNKDDVCESMEKRQGKEKNYEELKEENRKNDDCH